MRECSLKEIIEVDPVIHDFFQKKLKPILPNSTPIKKNELPITQPIKTLHKQPPSPSQSREAIITSSPSLQPLPNLPTASPAPHSLSSPKKSDPIAPIPPAEIQKSLNQNKTFSLEPMQPPSELSSFHECWKIYPSLFPHWTLSKSIPSDEMVQRANFLRKKENPPVILILSFHDREPQLTFLNHIAHAISLRLAPAQVLLASQIEKEKGWEKLLSSTQTKLVIAPDYDLYSQPQLMQFYREVPQQGKHFLKQIPLLLLSDLSLYLKDPQLKPLLWRAICNEFAQLKINSKL